MVTCTRKTTFWKILYYFTSAVNEPSYNKHKLEITEDNLTWKFGYIGSMITWGNDLTLEKIS